MCFVCLIVDSHSELGKMKKWIEICFEDSYIEMFTNLQISELLSQNFSLEGTKLDCPSKSLSILLIFRFWGFKDVAYTCMRFAKT